MIKLYIVLFLVLGSWVVDEILYPTSPSKIIKKSLEYSIKYYKQKELYMQNKKDYYLSHNGVSTFELMKAVMTKEQFTGYLLGNVIKYLSRYGRKELANDDLEKAKHYTDIYIEIIGIDNLYYRDDLHVKVIANLLKGDQLQALNEFNKWRDEFEKEKIL